MAWAAGVGAWGRAWVDRMAQGHDSAGNGQWEIGNGQQALVGYNGGEIDGAQNSW